MNSHLIRPRAILAILLAGALTAELALPPARAAESIGNQRVRVAAISYVPKKFDLAGNADRLEHAFRKAAAGGAKLAVAPEGALDGFVIAQILEGEVPATRMHEVAIAIDHPLIRRFQTLAKALDLCVVFGFAEQISADVFNTAVFIDADGKIRGKYHKMQFAEGYQDDWWFSRLGSQSRAFDTPFGRCGVLICNDRWNATLARLPALDGAQFLVIPSFGAKGKAQDEAVVSRGRENGLPVIEANVGVSLIVSDGKVVALGREEESITFAEIDIPGPIPSKPAERDEMERAFLAWRTDEMERRYESQKQRFGKYRKVADGIQTSR